MSTILSPYSVANPLAEVSQDPDFPVQEITLHPGVTKLFTNMVMLQEGSYVYSNRVDHCSDVFHRFVEQGMRATTIGTPAFTNYRRGMYTETARENQVSHVQSDTPEWYGVNDQFHASFAFYPFRLDWAAIEQKQVLPLYVRDKMSYWKISQGKDERLAPLHLVGLEGLMKATMVGGYFGAVLPKRWAGREMRYLRWWQERAATVARIELPEEGVMCKGPHHFEPLPGESYHEWLKAKERFAWAKDDRPAPGTWELVIWHRPVLGAGQWDDFTPNSAKHNADRMAPHALYRHSPFVARPVSFSLDSMNEVLSSFKQNAWFKQSIKMQYETVGDQVHSDWCGTWRQKPRMLPSLEDLYFFEPTPSHQYDLKVKPIEAIKADPLSVQIQITSRIKLSPHSRIAAGLLLEYRQRQGFTQNKDGSWYYNVDEQFHRKNFSDIKEDVLQRLSDVGLVPCMTPDDHHRFVKRERWLARQLTPIERWVPVQKVHSADQLSSEEDAWEQAYSDTGMWSTFPEVMKQWSQRAKKIQLDKLAYEFQFGDILVKAAKDGVLNALVMGLGKTIENCMAAILSGVDRCLIVCPRSLIDVWKDDIQLHLVPWARRVRRNWNGKLLDTSINVIEWAEHCRPENLKFFNIISYDRLRLIPNDVEFYRCPKCGMIACRRKVGATSPMFCPGNPSQKEENRCSHAIKQWKQECAGDDEAKALRKYAALVDSSGELVRRHGDIVKVKWQAIDMPDETGHVEFPRERIRIIDERPPRPTMTLMEKLDNKCKKIVPVIKGYSDKEDPITGQKIPLYRMDERDFHVAWTFADILRPLFPTVILDEALKIMNDQTLRFQACEHLRGRRRVANTGTPIKGMPQRIVPIANWVAKREVFPDYRRYDDKGMKRFLDKYKTEVKVTRQAVDLETGLPVEAGTFMKQVAKINNPELFQAEFACMMLRHTRNEPIVVKDIPAKRIIYQDIKVDMDDDHRAWYKRWQDFFVEWYEQKSKEEDGVVKKGQLITKITYLINASSIPHYMYQNILESSDDIEAKEWAKIIGPFRGKPTAKMRKSWDMILEAMKQGDKTIVFSCRQRNQDMGEAWAKLQTANGRPVYAIKVDGRTPMDIKKGQSRSYRHELIEKFKEENYNVLFAGLGALGEGYNIHQANHGILLDADWDHTAPSQGMGRMVRPQQVKPIYQTQLMHTGTMDDYMVALCYLKSRSAGEGIDYMAFDDFNVEMIPDIHQFAQAIVDGTQEIVKAKMWLAVEDLRKKAEEEGE